MGKDKPPKVKAAKVGPPRPPAPAGAAPPPPAGPPPPAPDRNPVRRLIDAATGAKLCYGEPVRAGDRVVIPVARVSAAGGWGFGRGRGGDGDGGDGLGHGGGGTFDARPVGFIDAGPDGARFQSVPDPDQTARTLRAAATAFVTVTTAATALRARRRAAGLLARGRG